MTLSGTHIAGHPVQEPTVTGVFIAIMLAIGIVFINALPLQGESLDISLLIASFTGSLLYTMNIKFYRNVTSFAIIMAASIVGSIIGQVIEVVLF